MWGTRYKKGATAGTSRFFSFGRGHPQPTERHTWERELDSVWSFGGTDDPVANQDGRGPARDATQGQSKHLGQAASGAHRGGNRHIAAERAGPGETEGGFGSTRGRLAAGPADCLVRSEAG